MIKELIKEILKEELKGQEPRQAIESPESNFWAIGCRVIVRARNAGVHYGTLVSAGDFITLHQSHRIWKWEGAFTLSEVSQKGITGGRVAMEVPQISIPIQDVGEVITLSKEADEIISKFVES